MKRLWKMAMGKMLDKCREYDKIQIRGSVVDRFNNKIIGEQLYHLIPGSIG